MTSGLPVYSDIERGLIDPIDSEPAEHDWQPGNIACQKLFRCIEALRDIHEVIDDVHKIHNTTKRRRRLKLLATPLFTFATCIDDLLNDCIGNSDTRSKLSDNHVTSIGPMQALLAGHVPFKKGGLLAQIRNKTSAHIDQSLPPQEARQLLNNVAPKTFGLWLDVCITVFCDVLKLPIYFWTCNCKYPDVIRLLAAEPILASFKIKDGHVSEFVGAHLIKQSPRKLVATIVFDVFQNSRWMFGPIDPQIRAFYYDEKDATWAQSIENLERLGTDGIPSGNG